MGYLKVGDNTYKVVEGQQLLLDSGDNWNVSADGEMLFPKPHAICTKLTFRCRFALPELVGIDNYALNQTLTADQKATMLTIMKNFDAATQIDLYDPRIVEGVQYIESTGLIAAGRAAEILAPS